MDNNVNKILIEKIASRLGGPISYTGPLLVSTAIVLSLLADLLGASPVLGLVFLYPALLGGFLEFYFLLHLVKARSIVTGQVFRGFGVVVRAAWSVPFYYTVLGVPLVAWQVKVNLEHILGTGIDDTKCKGYYNHLLFVLSFGFLLAPFQRCVGLAVADELNRVLSEPPEGFSAEGDEGEEYSGRPDTPV